jgi:D-alanyl-D-alanine carboxypeptidase
MSKATTVGRVVTAMLAGVVIGLTMDSAVGFSTGNPDFGTGDPDFSTGNPNPSPPATSERDVDIADVAGPTTGPPCPVDRDYQDEQPTGMRPEAVRAWQRVRAEATQQGMTLCLHDGKRSAAQQQREFNRQASRYGEDEAARRVLPPEKSMHVKGLAVDVQPKTSAAWLEQTAGKYGWCRRYDNEYWHFEYNASYPTAGCPARQPHS